MFNEANRLCIAFHLGYAKLENIQNNNGVITSNKKSKLDARAPVSLNMWGFRPFIFDYLEEENFPEPYSDNDDEIKSNGRSLIIIDPVDIKRNLGTAISLENVSIFTLSSRNFIQNKT